MPGGALKDKLILSRNPPDGSGHPINRIPERIRGKTRELFDTILRWNNAFIEQNKHFELGSRSP